MRPGLIGIIITICLLLSNISIVTANNVTNVLSPLKQVKNGIERYDIECLPNFQLINKREDGSPACVKPDTFVKLLSIQWGFDHTKQWTFDGIKDTYKVRGPIVFGVKFQGLSSLCLWADVKVQKENKTIWSGNLAAMSCAPHPDFHYLEQKWTTGPNSNLGNLVLNETGVYSVFVNGNFLQKNITIIS
jgi:hypothetical protein